MAINFAAVQPTLCIGGGVSARTFKHSFLCLWQTVLVLVTIPVTFLEPPSDRWQLKLSILLHYSLQDSTAEVIIFSISFSYNFTASKFESLKVYFSTFSMPKTPRSDFWSDVLSRWAGLNFSFSCKCAYNFTILLQRFYAVRRRIKRRDRPILFSEGGLLTIYSDTFEIYKT